MQLRLLHSFLYIFNNDRFSIWLLLINFQRFDAFAKIYFDYVQFLRSSEREIDCKEYSFVLRP